MNNFDSFLLSSILISFPPILYLLYVAHNKNIEKQENELFLGLALFSSMYLLIKLGSNYLGEKIVVLINIPIIISYTKNRKNEGIILSMVAITYYFFEGNRNIFFSSFEYVIYYILYLLKSKEILKMNNYIFGTIFITIKLIAYSFEIGIQNYNSFMIMLEAVFNGYLIMLFVSFLLKKGNNILKYHMNFKELEQEKQIRLSLFKITHEIKNPLAVCKGYLDMLNVNNSEQCSRYIPIIKDEIDRTLLLLQDFLSVNKIKLDTDILDVSMLLEESLSSLETLMQERKIKLNLNSDEEIYINGDYNRLSQVIINVVKNSIEALDNIENGFININTELTTKYVYIYFEDNGIGITKENMKKISEPFFTTKPRGTGLGVALSYEIVKAHNGTITYESEYNKGTKVTIKIPLMD